MKTLHIAAFAAAVTLAALGNDEKCPISENVRGHENIEWSIAYAYGLTDDTKDLPRVLLVGDSICNGYQSDVRDRLKGKVNVSYWVSSYCVTSPAYLPLLSVYLDEAKYDVIHFNNGLHSLSQTTLEAYAKGYRAALELIRRKQPQAKIVWSSCTPLYDIHYTGDRARYVKKVSELNAVAAKVAAEFGVAATDDLFALCNPLDRKENWRDGCHFNSPVIAKQADQVAASVLAALATRCIGGELEVSPEGMSPKDALLAIRAAKADGNRGAWTVRVKEGLYTLNETLVFTPEDSGEPGVPVTWIGEGDKVVFVGGQRLTGWKDIGGGVWSAPIPPAPDGRPAFFEQMWVNGRRADRARLPNSTPEKPIDGYLNVTAASISPMTNENGKVTYVEHAVFSNATELATISADELRWAQMCVIHKWSFARRVIKSVDPATLTVETHSPEDWIRWRKWEPGVTIAWFENVRSAFDAPGEWFYDAKNGVVLYRPLPDEDMSKAEVLVPSSGLNRLVEFRGDPDKGAYVHDIAFRGISFAATSATSGGERGPTQFYQYQAARDSDGAVTVMGARRLSFDSCRISHTGNYGMRFDDGCTSNAVTNCELDDLGAGGVWMGAQKGYVVAGETLSRRVITTLAPRSTAFNRLENCLIRGGGKFNPEGTGVALTHVSDSKVANCEICDFMYTGVSVGFEWGFIGSVAQRNEIAFNKIYDLGKGVMSDMGGVYTLGTSYGTTVHDNVIHDVWAYSYGGWALYADEGSEGIVMERNLCWNTTDGGFHQHYGVGCIIRNNIFAWNRKLGAVRMARQIVDDIPCTLHFVNNIVVVKEGPLVGNGPRGVGGVWARNLWYDYSGKPELDGLDWNAWKDCGKEICGAYADPCFVDADANDFRLRSDSPAFALGFKPWDYSKAGR